MLRAAFWLTALIFLPVGLFLYFLPVDVQLALGVSPMWLARVAGGILTVWGVFLFAASAAPDLVKTGALVGANLLTVATLLPALLRTGEQMPDGLRLALLGLTGLLGLLAVVAIFAFPSRRYRL
ncbi:MULTISPECIES: hypothetical protein [Deinococcus]|uniref:Uncharacterized protein n=2 Tax=Deinococcus TaxID=1298 RepID=A0A221SUP9_9DEIO|nr:MULTISPECIES: hypothetical protein [Deinococcus]ASN80376.1 hypothetical protein DFI_04555 [Deinococcus ficus]MDP9763667.1 putative MnhB-related membrane protein [Deinococcus enclensis]